VRLQTVSEFGVRDSLEAEINGRLIGLHGWGEPDLFDSIAATLRPVGAP
jgi:hypothetical protein